MGCLGIRILDVVSRIPHWAQPRRDWMWVAGGSAPGKHRPLAPFPSPRERGEGCRRRGVGPGPGVSPPATQLAPLRGVPTPRNFLATG